MALSFSVPGKPVGTNAAYRAGKGRYYLTKDAKAFKERLRAYAVLAKNSSDWKPSKKPIGVHIVVWNSRHDADSPVKFCLDALQGIFFENDRIVESVKAEKRKDNGEPRVDFRVFVIE